MFFALQYIAGETLTHAIKKICELNDQHISATLDLLGEDPKKRSDCLKAVGIYKKAIQQIHDKKLPSGISLKPSHMGLKIDKGFCFENIKELVVYAAHYNIFVRIDMEDVTLKGDTMDIFLQLKKEYENVGIVMQAYLRSGIDDINRMIHQKANVRLCKGAYYWEDKKKVYKDMDIINSSYAYLLKKLLSNSCFVGIATHDEKIVFEAIKMIDELGIPKNRYEFQMLYGVADDLRTIIMSLGHPVRVYVPFGEEWFAYSIRRLKENPKMISYIFSNGIKGIIKRS